MSLIILFGLPGSGKTYVGNVIAKNFPYYFHDGDLDLPEAMKQRLAKKLPITDSMRDIFFDQINQQIQRLKQTHKNIVVAQTFIKEKYREQLLTLFPELHFLLIEAESSIREKRLADRLDYPLDLEYSRSMVSNFDPPTIPYSIIVNNTDGEKELLEQLKTQ